MTKVAIIGHKGQLGTELINTQPPDPEIDVKVFSNLDVTTNSAIDSIRAECPNIIINASAYTKVDLAETEPEAAYAVNHQAVQNIARLSQDINARFLHVSTDFVFPGDQPTPYRPSDMPNPLSVYGLSKHKGEEAIQAIPELNYAIVRTAWVYSASGQNFVKTMLRLFSERTSLGVVYDQVGSPTWAKNLAGIIWQLSLQPQLRGIYHYSDAGVTSWYDFAQAIQEEATQLGLTDKTCKIHPILSRAYPTPAKRPHFSVLECSDIEQALGIERQHWRSALRAMLKDL